MSTDHLFTVRDEGVRKVVSVELGAQPRLVASALIELMCSSELLVEVPKGQEKEIASALMDAYKERFPDTLRVVPTVPESFVKAARKFLVEEAPSSLAAFKEAAVALAKSYAFFYPKARGREAQLRDKPWLRRKKEKR